jgi:hypothetical protein
MLTELTVLGVELTFTVKELAGGIMFERFRLKFILSIPGVAFSIDELTGSGRTAGSGSGKENY